VNSEGFRETFLRNSRKTQGAKMARKKDANQKAGPCGQTEKTKEKTKSSAGTKVASGGSGRETAQRSRRQPLQEQASEPRGCTQEERGTVYVAACIFLHGVGVSHD
jgi:hypothetical protein